MSIRVATNYCIFLSALMFAGDTHLEAIAAPTARPIIDGRIQKADPKITKAEQALVKRKVLTRAKDFWQCDSEFEVCGKTEGFFTSRRAKQTAFLYRYNSTGHNFANDGIAVFENGKLVGHFAYQGGWEYGIICLPDLDGDGLNEIALEGGFTNMGESTSTVFLYSLNPKKRRRLATILTSDYVESPPAEKPKETAYQLFAIDGKNPRFETQQYEHVNKKWIKVGAREKVKEERFSQAYKMIDLKSNATIADVAD